jgi:predicted phosphoribosyltransferase
VEASVILIVVFAAVALAIEVAKLLKTALDVVVTCPALSSLEASATTVAT